MATKKLKLDEEAITKILVADTDSESGAEVSDVDDEGGGGGPPPPPPPPWLRRVLKDTLHDYWSRLRQTRTPFFGETMTRDKFLHILRFLHFANNSQRPDQSEEYDRMWKLRTVFDILYNNYTKFYNPS